MNGHARKRGTKWEILLELGEREAQRCPLCLDRRGRSRRYWTDDGRLDACPVCGGPLEDVKARRQVTLPERFRTKKEAKEALTAALHASAQGTYVDPSKLTLGEYLVDHWLPSIEESVRTTTLIAYRSHVTRYIVPLMGDVPLRKLTTTRVNDFHAALRKLPRRPRRRKATPRPREASKDSGGTQNAENETPRPLSERTRRHVHVTLVIALNAAVRTGLLAVNPAIHAKAPQRRDTGELRTWADGELRTFLEATREDRWFPLWRLLAMSGMRRGEALGLKWQDVDFDAGRLRIQRTRVLASGEVLEHPPKTRAGRRAVSLDATTLAALRSWRAKQNAERLTWGSAWNDGGWVFTREDGEPPHPGMISKAFDEAIARAAVPRIRLHDLRHTSATLALAAGEHPKVVQERLGHATITQTMDTYSHTTPALHEEAAARLAALVDGEA